MRERVDPPRVAPLGEAERTAEQAAVLAALPPGADRSNIFTTLVRFPELLRTLDSWRVAMFGGALSARDRELVTLRTAWNCECEYEWGQHTWRAAEEGITEVDLNRIVEGPDAPGWSARDRVVLRAVDELHHDSVLSPATWEALAAFYDERQLIQFPFLVGCYHMLAYAVNSFGVQSEVGDGAFPDGVRNAAS